MYNYIVNIWQICNVNNIIYMCSLGVRLGIHMLSMSFILKNTQPWSWDLMLVGI